MYKEKTVFEQGCSYAIGLDGEAKKANDLYPCQLTKGCIFLIEEW